MKTRILGSSRFHGLLMVATVATLSAPPAEAQMTNLALNKPARQSSLSAWSTGERDAQGAVDGIKNGSYAFHTNAEPNPWWQVDLQQLCTLSEVRVFNRVDLPGRARTLQVQLSPDGNNWQTAYSHNGTDFGGHRTNGGHDPLVVPLRSAQARFVRLQLTEQTYFHLDEVEVYGVPAGAAATQARVRTQKAFYAPNEQITVEFADLPGNQSDWISIAKVGAPENSYESGRWTYVNGERSGSRNFAGLPAGQYEARVYFNWSSGGFTIQARYPFTVAESGGTTPTTTAQLSGYWDSTYGIVALVQQGNRIQGYYAPALGIWWGSLIGEVKGNVIEGTWGDGLGSGWFRFTLAADGRGFEGHWWHNDRSYGSAWNGRYRAPLQGQ